LETAPPADFGFRSPASHVVTAEKKLPALIAKQIPPASIAA
jgi:hypothetical protein